MSKNLLHIDGEKIPRGSNATLELNIARLPSETKIHLPIHIFRSKYEGPIILLSGGLHGDEVNGIEIVRQMIDSNLLDRLLCGTVIALPIINIYGFINFSREVPDGKDVNRNFPGTENGSLASYVAYTITNKILPLIDFGIDFHTGGASRTNYPQIRLAPEDERAHEIATAFGAPFTLYSNLIKSSLREQAWSMGKSMLVYEGGEALRFDDFAINEAVRGIQRVLKHYKMIKNAPKRRQTRWLRSSQWVRADTSGLFRSIKRSGNYVKADDVIGVIHGPANRYEVPITADVEGYIIGHNNIPVVHRGDALFHIAQLKNE